MLINASVKVNPDPPQPRDLDKKRQMRHHVGHEEIVENAPPLGQLKMFLMSL